MLVEKMRVTIQLTVFFSMVVYLVGCRGTLQNDFDKESKEAFADKPRVTSYRNGIDNQLCLLHNVNRIEDVVPVIYGDLSYMEGYLVAESNMFPNALTFISGGCIVGLFQDEDEILVRYCPECRKAKKKWNQLNNKPWWELW